MTKILYLAAILAMPQAIAMSSVPSGVQQSSTEFSLKSLAMVEVAKQFSKNAGIQQLIEILRSSKQEAYGALIEPAQQSINDVDMRQVVTIATYPEADFDLVREIDRVAILPRIGVVIKNIRDSVGYEVLHQLVELLYYRTYLNDENLPEICHNVTILECLLLLKTFSPQHLLAMQNLGLKEAQDTILKKAVVCGQCDTIFAYCKDLTKHLRYACDVCDYITCTKRHLTMHKRTHDAYGQYVCNECGNEFGQSINLTRHMRLHAAPNLRNQAMREGANLNRERPY